MLIRPVERCFWNQILINNFILVVWNSSQNDRGPTSGTKTALIIYSNSSRLAVTVRTLFASHLRSADMQKLNFLSPLFHKNGKKCEGRQGGRKNSSDNRKGCTDKCEKGPKRKTFTLFNSSRHAEDLIVTPFAQILASLRSVRANYVSLTNVPANKER